MQIIQRKEDKEDKDRQKENVNQTEYKVVRICFRGIYRVLSFISR